MAQSEMQRRQQLDSEIRRRIDALNGKIEKPSEAMARRSIQPLLDKLNRQRRNVAANAGFAEQHIKRLAQIHHREVKVSREASAAAKAYRAALVKRGRAMVTQPPRATTVPPQIRSGSILSVVVPPYDSRWADGTSSNPSFLNGTWSTGSNANDHSYAGVCIFFNPLPGLFMVRFAPYMPINYSYLINTYSSPDLFWGFSRAGASGFVGAFVAGSRDGGATWEEVADQRATVFDEAVSVNDDSSGGDDNAVIGVQAEFHTFLKPVLFALWAWGGVSTSERDGPGPDFGFSQANMSASIPVMVIEQDI